MALRLVALTVAAQDPDRLAAFWSALLDRPLVPGLAGPLLPGYGGQVGLAFAAGPADVPPRLHLHVTSDGPLDQAQTVERVLSLGAQHLDVGQLPDEGHVVLADPEGGAFCVIEPESTFLAGCGPLGEVACDGGRDVGVFWSEALGWPLVWDEGDETAVQSPEGGTKVAWGGAPETPLPLPARHWLDLVGTDGDVERLVALGAERVGTAGRAVVLVDPAGAELRVRTELLHGTAARLAPGDELVAGRVSNFQPGRTMNHVYLTSRLETAVWGAELATALTGTTGRGHVYVVEATGELEDDPNVTDKRFPGNPTESYRSRQPLRVVGEVLDWEGHPPGQLQAMLDGLARLRAQGQDVIED